MKLIPGIIVLLLLSISTNAKIRLYSRALREKYVADSLRAIDSVRIADSLRIAKHIEDSLTVARYQAADKAVKEDKIKKEKELEIYKPVDIDSTERSIEEDMDNVSARTIVIDENSEYAGQIDSIQKVTDSINNRIYSDSWFKNMKMFPLSEKKRYMNYLMQNKFKDTTAILKCCNQLYQIYSNRMKLYATIRNSQDTNTKSFMTNHIELLKEQTAELSNYIVVLSRDVPAIIQHQNASDSSANH